MSKISGPLLDRIDIHIEVPSVPYDELASQSSAGTSSGEMRADVEKPREVQNERFAGCPAGVRYNAQMTSRQVREHCALHKSCREMLRNSFEEMGLSARADDKILRVSRTIAKNLELTESSGSAGAGLALDLITIPDNRTVDIEAIEDHLKGQEPIWGFGQV